MMITRLTRPAAALAFLSLGAVVAAAQAPPPAEAGPIVQPYGAVYRVPATDFPTRTDLVYRVVFDLSDAPADPKGENPRINTVARFLNMHAQTGVPPENLEVSLVLHGEAGRHALHPRAYRSRFEIDNPDLGLIEALARAGVEVYLCGQTAAHRGFAKSDLAAPVQLALSAMTVLATLQHEGYVVLSP